MPLRSMLQTGRVPPGNRPAPARARQAAPPLPALRLSSRSVLFRSLPLLLIVGLLVSGMVWNGYDSASGKAVSGIANGLAFSLAAFHFPPSARFRAAARPLLLCATLAFLWVVLPRSGSLPFPGGPVTLAPDMAMAEMVGYWAGVAALFCGALAARDARTRSAAFLLLAAAVAAVLLFGLVLRFTPLGEWADYGPLARQGRFLSTVGNANVTAALAGASALLALWPLVDRQPLGLTGRRALPLRIAMGLVLAVDLTAMVATASRFTIIAFFLGALWLAWPAMRARPARERYPIAGLMALAIAAALYFAPNAGLLSSRLGRLGVEAGDRLFMWHHYAGLALSAPLNGYGYGGFPSLNSAMLTSLEAARALSTVNSPHNILLQLVLVGGLPYALLIGAAAALWLRDLAARLKGKRIGPRRAAPLAALALLLASAMVDISLDYPVSTSIALFLAGLLWTPGAHQSRR